MNKLLALIAFLGLLAFIGILVMKVPRTDIAVVATLTLLLVAYDFLSSARDKKD